MAEKPRAQLIGRRMSCAYVRMGAVDCTADELAHIAREVEGPQLEALSGAVQQALDISDIPPLVDVVFFGNSLKLEPIPRFVQRHITRIRPGAGVWIRGLRAVFVLLTNDINLRSVVIHELARALLNLFTKNFAFPIALAEGAAMVIQRRVLTGNEGQWRANETANGESASGTLRESDFMSIQELLSFDLHEWAKEADREAYDRMIGCGWFLVAYTSWLRLRAPTNRPLLAELRTRNITEPQEVRQLMANMYRLGVEEMEEGFRRYCIIGEMPR